MTTYSHNGPSPKGKVSSPKSVDSLLLDIDSELRRFHGNFAFAVASPAEKDAVFNIAARLLAESRVLGASADLKLCKLIEVLKAHAIRADTPAITAKIEAFEGAETFLATCPPAAKIRASQDEAENRLAEAEAAVAAAERRRDEIKRELALLAGQAERRADAERVTATRDQALLSAMAHLKSLRAAAEA